MPVVLRHGVPFHPETTFALPASLAVLLFVRAHDAGWPSRTGSPWEPRWASRR